MASRLRTASTAAKRRMQGVHEVGRREGYVQKVDESSGREDAAVAEERVGRGEGAERTALDWVMIERPTWYDELVLRASE